MAYFERADERDKMIVCNICNVKCAERGITTHKAKCAAKENHKVKFSKGDLERCAYDSSHIVNRGMMSIHLEFCNKRQCQLVAEYQLATKASDSAAPEELPIAQAETKKELPLDDWGRDANSENFVAKLSKLRV